MFAAGWYLAGELMRPAAVTGAPTTVTVVDVGDAAVTLERRPETMRDGVWGLQWPDGYARVAERLEADADTVTRRLVPVSGSLEEGQAVRMDAGAYPSDPGQAFFFPTERVRLEGHGGDMTADVVTPAVAAPDQERTRWRIGGPRDTWVVLVPGGGASRGEAFRLVPTMRALGFPALILHGTGEPSLAETSWRGVAAASDHAFDRGADDVVLVGLSTGGAAVSRYLHESEDAERVVGVVLDAPVLDWDAALSAAAADRGVPAWLRPTVRRLAALRTGTRRSRLDQLARAEHLATPVLLFHGTADAVVPARSSDAFADARPDLVTFVPVEGAGHVQSWNVDPDAYDRHLRAFLTTVTGAGP